MKIAAGCFGCLAVLFVAMMFATGTLIAAVTAANPEIGEQISPLTDIIRYANGGCCCMSGTLAIVFLAIGMMGGKKDAEA